MTADEAAYYRINVAALTVAELWRFSPNLVMFLFLLLVKLRGSRWPAAANSGVARSDEIAISEIPAHARHASAEDVSACERAGFVPSFALRSITVGDQEGYNQILANRAGTIIAMCLYSRQAAYRETAVAIISLLENGRVVCVTNTKKRLNSLHNRNTVYLRGRPVEKLLARHQAQLREIGESYPRTLDDYQRRQAVKNLSDENMRFNIQRGAFVPLSAEEAARLQAQSLHS